MKLMMIIIIIIIIIIPWNQVHPKHSAVAQLVKTYAPFTRTLPISSLPPSSQTNSMEQEQSSCWEAASSAATNRISQHFMEPEGSLPCSQEASIGPYPELDQSNPYHPILPLLRSISVHLILHDLIILITLGQEYKLWSSSLRSFLLPPVTSFLFGPNIPPSLEMEIKRFLRCVVLRKTKTMDNAQQIEIRCGTPSWTFRSDVVCRNWLAFLTLLVYN
jgi:hypothetical protein